MADVDHTDEPAATAPRSSSSETRIGHMEEALEPLLSAYRGVLTHVERLPTLGRVRTSMKMGTTVARPEGSALVARSITRIYVQTHIHHRLRALVDAVGVERLTLEQGAAIDRLKEIESTLDSAADNLFNWSRLKALVIRIPLVSTAISLISALTASGIGLSAGSEALTRQARSAAIVLLVVAFLTYYALVLPSISLGFRVKRALLAGGCEPRRLLFDPNATPVQWDAFPTANVYHLEDAAFRAMERPRTKERPLDLFLELPQKLFVVVMFGLWVVGVSRPFAPVVALLALVALWSDVRTARGNYRQRAQTGDR